MWRFLILAQADQFDIKVLRFPETQSGASNQMIMVGMAVAAAIVIVAGVALLIYQRQQSIRRHRQHSEERFQALLTELELGADERVLVGQVTGSDDPASHLAMLESRPAFERVVREFRERNPKHPALRRIGSLRQRLGFGFGNLRVPFTDTRMMSPGLRIQCKITHPKGEITFVTGVVSISETQFWIRPPSAKGKPVTMEKFPELGFRVSRENDAEYEFNCRVLGQAPNAMRAVALEHTNSIRRLFFRNAPRIPVDLQTQLYVVRQDSTEKSQFLLRARDSQFALRSRLKDLSTGGALAFAQVEDQTPREGDTVIFHLAEAQIRDDLVAEVMRTVPRENRELQLHLKFVGVKELDRLKLNKYLTNLSERSAASGANAP